MGVLDGLASQSLVPLCLWVRFEPKFNQRRSSSLKTITALRRTRTFVSLSLVSRALLVSMAMGRQRQRVDWP